MNVYCVVCKREMEIIEDLGTELRVSPCGCDGVLPDGSVCTSCKDGETIDGVCLKCGFPFPRAVLDE